MKKKKDAEVEKKGQTALEYILNYSWAIVIVIVVGISLYQLGIFTPSPGKISSGFDEFSVGTEFKITAGGEAVLSLTNVDKMSRTVTINNVTVEGQECTVDTETVGAGDSFTVTCAGLDGGSGGSPYTGIDVVVSYTVEGMKYTETGEISGKYEGTIPSDGGETPPEEPGDEINQPPVIVISGTHYPYCIDEECIRDIHKITCYVNQDCILDGSESYDTDGTITQYHWHRPAASKDWYTAVINDPHGGQGTWFYYFTVTDDGGLNNTKSVAVTVRTENETPSNFTNDTIPPTVSVSTGSPTYEYGSTVSFNAVANDNIALYDVEVYFEDSRQGKRQISHCPPFEPANSPSITCYNEESSIPSLLPGDHYYYAVANDMAGNEARDPPNGTKIFTIVVSRNYAPYQYLSVSPRTGLVPTTVTFDATGTFDPNNDPITYHWNFGDGTETTTITEIVTHEYTTAGLYHAVITASDPGGLSSKINYYINISNISEEEGDTTQPIVMVKHTYAGPTAEEGVIITANSSDNEAIWKTKITFVTPSGNFFIPECKTIPDDKDPSEATQKTQTCTFDYTGVDLTQEPGLYAYHAETWDSSLNHGMSELKSFSVS